MQTVEELLKKKFNKNASNKQSGGRRRIKFQFQDIACEIAKEMNITGKDRGRLFGFIKQKIENGQWWKVKEVREYMASKNIKSLRYFMAAFRTKNNEQGQSKGNSN